MKSNKLMFWGLYLLGVVLCITLFLVFVPPESRTDVKWLDLCLGVFLYSGLWYKFVLLAPARGRFADNVPMMTVFWLLFGWYAVAAVLAMAVMGALGVGFGKQALIQACLLFAFAIFIACGAGASNFIRGESARIQEQVGGMRDIQFKASQIRIVLAALPQPYAFARREFDGIVDGVTCIGRSNNPRAREAEVRILALLDKLQLQADLPATPEECLATVKALALAVSMRKTVTNV